MPTRNELRELAKLRLREAETLFNAGLYDGSAYLCGYVIEFALKARICKLLGIDEYPASGRLKSAYAVHDFGQLLLSPQNLAKAQRRRVKARVSPLFFAPLRLCERYEMGECVFSESLKRALNTFLSPIRADKHALNINSASGLKLFGRNGIKRVQQFNHKASGR